MPSLKSLKTRIKSVNSTRKMTKAMKMVAASRLKKAKKTVESSRPYASKIQEMIVNLASNVSVRENLSEKFPLLTGKGRNQTYLLVAVSSDRGLCGGLNGATVKFTKKTVAHLTSLGHEVKIFCVGKKAYEQLKNIYGNKIIGQIFGVFKGNVEYESARNLAQQLVTLFDQNQFDICQIVYSKFRSALSQEQVCEQIIPAPIEIKDKVGLESPMQYEPSEEEILSELLPKNLAMQIYHSFLENSASEQGSRMAAMESASNNAAKMIKNLTLVYNRTRQANITRELIDIVSGANAV